MIKREGLDCVVLVLNNNLVKKDSNGKGIEC